VSLAPKARDAAKAYYVWRHYNPNSADDPLAAWSAGYEAGGDAMRVRSAAWVGLEPTLEDLLEELRSARIRRERDQLDQDAEAWGLSNADSELSAIVGDQDEQEELPF
jgi:uncharacterized Ntn-hydrolase superfamily protein